MTNEHGKSDRLVVPKKSLNNSGQPVAEDMEERGLAMGNLDQQYTLLTESRVNVPNELPQIRRTANSNQGFEVHALISHIYRIDTLRVAYFQLKK